MSQRGSEDEILAFSLKSIEDLKLTYPSSDRPWSKRSDEQTIAHFGKRQQFKRNFNLLTVLALSCTITNAWAGMFSIQSSLVFSGGPTASVITFPIVFLGVLTQALVIGELSSMIPLSGGQYNWVAILSPPAASNFLSYLTGWILTIAWQSGTAGVTFMASNMIVALANAMHPSYEVKNWHATLVFFAIVGVAVFVTTWLGRVLPMVESFAFLLYVMGFFTMVIVMAYLSPKLEPSMVFNAYLNLGGWESNTQAVWTSIVPIMFGFNGFDASVHIAEEVENASRVIPKAVIGTACIFFAVGYSIMILSYFCFPAEAVLTSAYAFPVIDMFLSITQSKSGTATLVALIITMLIFGSIGILAAGSRMLWAFARESGVPGSRFIAAIHPSTHLPLYSILITALISILLGLIGLGSSAALNALTGLAVAGFYTAFIIAASMMLWRRLTMPAAKMPWGPFRLHAFGVPITILSLTYSVIGVVFSFWPPVKEVDKSSFNWSVVVFVGVIMLACGWWGVKARKTYTGPKVEISSQQWMDLFKEPEGGAAEHKSHEA